jgi:hypothetical protein
MICCLYSAINSIYQLLLNVSAGRGTAAAGVVAAVASSIGLTLHGSTSPTLSSSPFPSYGM